MIHQAFVDETDDRDRFAFLDFDQFALRFDNWEFRQETALANHYSITSKSPDKISLDSTIAGHVVDFSLLRRWLQDCVENHPLCKGTEQVWPTRLIYVGSSDSQRLRLLENTVEKIELSDKRGYAALSYCWGQPAPEEKKRFCLTDENSSQRLHGFSLTDLPKTFQHAVQVTRSLGLSLLWIDALCINQTDPYAPASDWGKEAARMQDVFSSASFTINATSATNWEDGFCDSASSRNRQKEMLEDVMSGFPHYLAEEFEPLQDNDFKKKVDNAPLNQRAWVLQERVLSRRLIHFAKDSTYWECGKLVRCDDFRELRCGLGRDYFLQDPVFPQRLTDSGYERTVDFLRTLFQNYARYELSVPSDREVAISGLVERMSKIWQTECRYGVFGRYIHRLLLWRNQDGIGNISAVLQDLEFRKIVPSWSWMVCSQINFFEVKKLKVPPYEQLSFDPSQHRNGLRVQIRKVDDSKRRREGSQLIITDMHDRHVGDCWPDLKFEVNLQHCVVVAMDDSLEEQALADVEKTYYVLFVKYQSGGDSYERVGAGTIQARCVSTHARKGRLV